VRLTPAALLFCLTAIGVPAAGAANDPIAGPARALAEAERQFGTADPRLLSYIDPLAQHEYRAGDIAAATALRRRGLKLAIGAFGGASVPAATAMTALARLYIEGQHYLDAEPLLTAAANVLAEAPGAAIPALTDTLAGRAAIALAYGRRRCARNWAEQAVALGSEDDRSAPHRRALRELGKVLAAEREFAASERVLRRALALDHAETDSLGAARSLAALANAYLRQKRFADALPAIEEAAAIDQERLGPSHPLIADDFYTIGLVYLATGRPGAAGTILRRAAELTIRAGGRGSPAFAYIELELARAERATGHSKEARSHFADARAILNAAAAEERRRERRI
jgi:tetratricopeptide (TPR) repeat protein